MDRDARDAVASSTSGSAPAPLARAALRYVFPDHWSFLLGEIALYAFVVLVATGIYLALFFEPSLRRRRLPRSVRAAPRPQMTKAYALGAATSPSTCRPAC